MGKDRTGNERGTSMVLKHREGTSSPEREGLRIRVWDGVG